MKITVANAIRADAVDIEAALRHGGAHYEMNNERAMLYECPFCGHEDPKPKANRKHSWLIGSGYRCVMPDCEAHGSVGPIVMMKQLGVEIEGSRDGAPRSTAQANSSAQKKQESEKPKPKPVPQSRMLEIHRKSVATLFEPGNQLGEMVRAYIASRGIALDSEYLTNPVERMTLGAWKTSEGPAIAFWYFTLDGKPLLCKYSTLKRTRKGKPVMMGKYPPGVEDVPFYREHLINREIGEVTLVEGEMDAETALYAGYPNPICVPDGAGASPSELRRALDGFPVVFVGSDNDAPGHMLAHRVRSEFAKDGVSLFRLLFGKFKDANDALVKGGWGEDEFLDALSKARSIHDTAAFIDHTYVRTGLNDFDRFFFGLRTGGYSHIFGPPGCGKSTFADALALNVSNAGHRVGYVSLEEPASETKARLCLMSKNLPQDVVERLRYDGKMEEAKTIIDELESTWSVIGRNLLLYGNGMGLSPMSTVDSMFDTIRLAADEGCDLVVVDNYSIIRNAMGNDKKRRGRSEEYLLASTIAQTLSDLASKYSIHILLLNHTAHSGKAYGEDRINQPALISFLVKNKGRRFMVLRKARRMNTTTGKNPYQMEYVLTMTDNGRLMLRAVDPREEEARAAEEGDF